MSKESGSKKPLDVSFGKVYQMIVIIIVFHNPILYDAQRSIESEGKPAPQKIPSTIKEEEQQLQPNLRGGYRRMVD